MKRVFGLCAGLVSAVMLILLVSCASTPRFTGSEKIAVVNFSMDRSIVRTGSSPDNGPGLLNDKRVDWWKYQKESVAVAWDLFKANYKDIFSQFEVVDISRIEGNPDIVSLTAPQKQSFMGLERSSDEGFVYPVGLNYTVPSDVKLVAKLAEKTNADLLLYVNLSASYDMTSGVTIGGVGGGGLSMIIRATVTLVNAKGSIVAVEQAVGVSKESVPFASLGIGESVVPNEEFPRLTASAMADLLPKLKTSIAKLY